MHKIQGRYLFAALAILLTGTAAQADERYSPVEDKLVIEECGACHMVFQPEMLPKVSWGKIMTGLSDHFGEDASLDSAAIQQITTYLQENAADTGWRDGKFMRGLSKNSAPLRITKTPYWVREHNEEVPQRAWNDPKVKTKSNCIACHKRANRGDYDDD